MTVSAPPRSTRGPAPGPEGSPARPRRKGGRRKSSLLAHGEPMVWLTGGALVVAMAMIIGLLGLVVWFGMRTFWPEPVHLYHLFGGGVQMGEVSRSETFRPQAGYVEGLQPEAAEAAKKELDATGHLTRTLIRVGNKDLTGAPFVWVSAAEVQDDSLPEWALIVERLSWGRFYGRPVDFLVDGKSVASGPEASWKAFQAEHGASRDRFREIERIEDEDVGRVSDRIERSRLAARQAELDDGKDSPQWQAANERFEAVQKEADTEYARLRDEVAGLKKENSRYTLVLETADGTRKELAPAEIVRAFPANQLGPFQKLEEYGSRWWEYLTAKPREMNTEGGVLPAIFGTVAMTLVMSLMVVPFGVLAALYLREYAKQGPIISMVRIAVNNLAGVPSIVFGVFGLGFFCYIVGAHIDQLFFAAKLPSPTFGKGGLLWASLTLALLTLPVVIVATEEALAAVPNSMREGSYACGATKWQTMRRIVLPRAAPGIMTGTILAIARGAGEVAPLMLVGAVKFAQELAVDGTFPFLHPQRSFMHLGFHIFDLGFQSPDSESAKPMVFTTTLLLISIVVLLNFAAIGIRARLRRKFRTSHV